MKLVLLFVFVIVILNTAHSQTALPSDSLYLVTYSLGKAWDINKKPNEQNYFKEHSTDLSSWRKSGIIKLGARYADKGMIIITAKSISAARDLITTDVAVTNQLFFVDIQKLSPFYGGCIERPE